MNYIFIIIVFSVYVQINGRQWFLATDNNYAKDSESTNIMDLNEKESRQEYLRQPIETSENSNHFYYFTPQYLSLQSYRGEFQNPRRNITLKTLSKDKLRDEIVDVIRSDAGNNEATLKFNFIGNNSNTRIIKLDLMKYGGRNMDSVKSKRPKKLQKTRRGKFLEVFEVVEFDHDVCISSSGLEGTCLHEFDCESSGGTSMGSCADGLGTCCVILFGCDTTSIARIGWFTNPNFPSPTSERLSCIITLNKLSNDIKQFRLDFTNFEILPPTDGSCIQDQFLVAGQDVNNIIPILCGINNGQHMYVEVGNTEEPVTLSIQTLNEENRLFSIKVTQLTAADELAAPTGCLQYYREDHGHLESFNYRDRSEIGIVRTVGYLNNLNYATCIKKSQLSCSITYTNAGQMQIVNYENDGMPLIPPQQAGVEIYNCPSDWLLIAAIRLCGERLNDGSVLQDFSLDAPVTDDGAGPIMVWFRSDGVYTGRGYKLHYQQNSCSTPS